MSTRCDIGIKTNNTAEIIYCHFDGYLSGVGKTLLENYTDLDKIKELMSLGSISSLGKELNGSISHSHSNPDKDVTVAYMRDRGEKNQEASVVNMDEVTDDMNDFMYLYDIEINKWIYCDYNNREFRELKIEDCK